MNHAGVLPLWAPHTVTWDVLHRTWNTMYCCGGSLMHEGWIRCIGHLRLGKAMWTLWNLIRQRCLGNGNGSFTFISAINTCPKPFGLAFNQFSWSAAKRFDWYKILSATHTRNELQQIKRSDSSKWFKILALLRCGGWFVFASYLPDAVRCWFINSWFP